MSETSKEALREHNYCMGKQIRILIEALGMHWQNQKALKEEKSIPYIRNFEKLIQYNDDVLTHNGILTHWQGVE